MKNENQLPTTRSLLGPALLLVVVVVAGAFLEVAADEGPETWLVRAFLVISLFAVAAYLLLVFLPERNLERRLQEVEERYQAQCNSLTESLTELRHGDLVVALEPLRELPGEMRSVMETTGALAGLFDQIQSSSIDVATSAGSVHETASELAAGSSQQAAAVVEITTTMEELARTARRSPTTRRHRPSCRRGPRRPGTSAHRSRPRRWASRPSRVASPGSPTVPTRSAAARGRSTEFST